MAMSPSVQMLLAAWSRGQPTQRTTIVAARQITGKASEMARTHRIRRTRNGALFSRKPGCGDSVDMEFTAYGNRPWKRSTSRLQSTAE